METPRDLFLWNGSTKYKSSILKKNYIITIQSLRMINIKFNIDININRYNIIETIYLIIPINLLWIPSKNAINNNMK